MPIIDEKGRLFGKINVIDAAALLLVLVFVVAGATYLIDTSEPATVHAQVEMADVPAGTVAELEVGDRLADGRITVTDLHTVQVTDDTHRVFAKLEITAGRSDGILRFDQTRLEPSASIPLTLGDTTLPARIVLLDGAETLTYLERPQPFFFIARDTPFSVKPDLPTGWTGIMAETHLLSIDGHLAALSADSRGSTPDTGGTDLYIWGTRARLSSGSGGDQAQTLGPGSTTTLSLPGLTVDGILQTAPGEGPPARVATTNVTVVARDVANDGVPLSAHVGDRESYGGGLSAEVVDVVRLDGPAVTASPLLLPGGLPSAPTEEIQVTLSVQGVAVGDRLEWKGRSLDRGREIVFRGGSSTFTGTVTDIGATPQASGTADVTLVAENLPPWAAGVTQAGDIEESAGGQVLLEVTDVIRSPSQMLVVTDSGEVTERDHPSLVDLTLQVTLHTQGSGQFKRTTVVPGSQVFIQPGGIPLQATVQAVEG